MEYTALYRRFRPLTFKDVVGQDHIVTTLKNQVKADRVGHAYLFTGCRGCGKTSSAKILARAINCLNPQDGEPCNECEICKSALDGSLTDIVEMDAASNNGVDDIRAIRDEVNFLPTIAKYRVYIIDEVHMLSPGAFNALLKTLEEPPKHVKFILATTEPQKLPATILSRCQRFDYKKISEENIVSNLEKICKETGIKYDAQSLNLIAELAEGAMRDALSILERCAEDGENEITEVKVKELVGIPETKYISNLVGAMCDYDEASALTQTESLIREGKDLTNLLWEITKYLRDMMLLKTTGNISNIYNKEDQDTLKQLTGKIEKERILDLIYEMSALQNELKQASQKNIIFQVGILKNCSERKTYQVVQNVSTLSAKKVESAEVNPATQRIIQPAPQRTNTNTVSQRSTEVASTKSISKSSNFWENVLNTLREERNQMLLSMLLGTRAIKIDDLTIGIEFPNGLDSFKRTIIEKSENMQELRRLISIECKKDMRVKLIDKKQNSEAQKEASPLEGLGLNINIIE